MKNELVSFEVAKLAKEKGFDVETCDFFSENIISNLVPQGDYKYLSINYDDIGEDISPHGFWNWNSTNESKRLITAFNESYGENFKEVFSAPTQSLLQRWLREKYKIYIDVKSCLVGLYDIEFSFENYEVLKHSIKHSKIRYKTYEQALEISLQEALKLIK